MPPLGFDDGADDAEVDPLAQAATATMPSATMHQAAI
jgi:hypothetical protein